MDVLHGRLAAEDGTLERLLAICTTADLALRLPAVHAAAMAWLDALIGKPASDADIRLTALVHRTRCTPQRIGRDLVPQAIELLRQSTTTPSHTPDGDAHELNAEGDTGTPASPPPTVQNVPPEIAAAFEDLERHNRVHAPTTSSLRTFHAVLDARIPERTALLTEHGHWWRWSRALWQAPLMAHTPPPEAADFTFPLADALDIPVRESRRTVSSSSP
ncbi:hypothetical protein [Streptomyces griseoluteus]|uniref:hypothetical protein n=1 Tax=Streptomyces griseoluteus TaxID=29306 RepID=UPI0037020ABD